MRNLVKITAVAAVLFVGSAVGGALFSVGDTDAALTTAEKSELRNGLGNRGLADTLTGILDAVDDGVGSIGFTVGTESSNVIITAVQLNDPDGNALTSQACVPFFFSEDANGDVQEAVASALIAGTDGHILEWTAETSGVMCSESDGDIDISADNGAGADTIYLCAVLPSGKVSCSGAITYT